ncbi:MAG TPA: hypothetical protein PLB10_14545 [Thiolinea sp.]|nr:hypothetical protein [Thiolinea sp.]
MNLHSEARTTPKIREAIKAGKGRMPLKETASHFNVSRATILKWQNRDSTADRSHPAPSAAVVELRRSLLLAVDDLLVVVREFIKPDRVYSGLIRSCRSA